MEYENSLDRDYDILMRRFEIAVERAEAIYTYESAINNSLCSEYMIEAKASANDGNESPEDKGPSKLTKVKNAFANFIEKITTYMKNLLRDVAEMFSNMFNTKDTINLDSYMNSETGKEKFDFDCVDASIKAADEVRKGRKLVQAISRGTHIDDATVEEYVDKASKYVIDHKEMVIAVPLAYALYKKGTKKTKAMAEEIDEAGKSAKNVTDPKKQAAIKKIFGAMQKNVKVGTGALHHYGSKLSKHAKKSKNKKDAD